MLIATGELRRDALAGQVAVVTGAGGGIGFEAARALLWLGAKVAIAEIDEAAGSEAAILIGSCGGVEIVELDLVHRFRSSWSRSHRHG